MHNSLHGRAEELAAFVAIIKDGLALADDGIPAINTQLEEMVSLGITQFQFEGPLLFSRLATESPAFDEDRVLFAAALVLPGGLGSTLWTSDEYAMRHGESGYEPICLCERFIAFEQCPPLVRALLPAHAPALVARLLRCFTILSQ